MPNSDYPNEPTARPGSPQTAFDAAKSMRDAARTIRNQVLHVVADATEHGATGDDAASTLGLHVTQVRSRLSELLAAGKIVNSGKVRLGASGRMTTVWVLPEYGPTPPESDQGDLWEEAA